MAFQEPDPSEQTHEQGTTRSARKKLAPIVVLGGGVIALILLLSLAF